MNESVEAPLPPNISLALAGLTDVLCVQNGHTSHLPEDQMTLNCTQSLLLALPSAVRRTFVQSAVGQDGQSAGLVRCAIEGIPELRRWAADMERLSLNDRIFAATRLDLVRHVLTAEKRGAPE